MQISIQLTQTRVICIGNEMTSKLGLLDVVMGDVIGRHLEGGLYFVPTGQGPRQHDCEGLDCLIKNDIAVMG